MGDFRVASQLIYLELDVFLPSVVGQFILNCNDAKIVEDHVLDHYCQVDLAQLGLIERLCKRNVVIGTNRELPPLLLLVNNHLMSK